MSLVDRILSAANEFADQISGMGPNTLYIVIPNYAYYPSIAHALVQSHVFSPRTLYEITFCQMTASDSHEFTRNYTTSDPISLLSPNDRMGGVVEERTCVHLAHRMNGLFLVVCHNLSYSFGRGWCKLSRYSTLCPLGSRIYIYIYLFIILLLFMLLI